MKLRRITAFPLVAIAACGMVLASCAKPEIEDGTAIEQMAFDAWVEKYVSGRGISVARQSNGMWVEFLADGDQSVESSSDTIVWLKLDYTATDIEGNVFVTRDSLEALRQRTFTPYTYYVPDYVYCGDENYGMPPGQYFALRNDLVKPGGSKMKLSEGSHVKLYVPSHLAYGLDGYSNEQGYGGQYALGETKIVIQDIAVKGVVKNPVEREEMLVVRHAEERWGLAEADTIKTLIFVDTLHFRPRAELLEKFPGKEFEATDSLGLDSLARIWYIGRFLPTEEYPEGFIFDTNIESVHEKFYNRRLDQNYAPQDKTFSALTYTPQKDREDYIAAFYAAIPALRRGQWSRIVFTSAYGYGATGLSASVKADQAYVNAYMDYYMYNSMYGNSYYDNYYYNSYYGGYNNYYNYSTSGQSDTEEEQTITTEIQPYTPLVFEIYIEAREEE